MTALSRPASLESLPGMAPAPEPATREEPPRKRLRAVPSWAWVGEQSTLGSLLLAALPDKEALLPEWLSALAKPSVSITSLEDVRRLDAEDIVGLPVPPLVKGVFREVLAREASLECEQRAVLEAAAARKQAFLAPLRDRNMQPPLAGSKYFQDQKNLRLILTHEEIEAGVRIVARRIENWCKGERIVLVGILKGAFMFLSDLCRALIRPYSVYFIEASSYKDERQQKDGVTISGSLPVSKFCDATTQAPHKIVLLDELLDSGHTMQEMKQYFLNHLASTHTEKDILTVCLFGKKRERGGLEVDITGIPDLPDLWLVGYGLDDRGTKRGWSELFAIPKVKIVETVDTEEVERLLANFDDEAVLTAPIIFAGFELTHNRKQRYRLSGLDTSGGQIHIGSTLQCKAAATIKKADVVQALADLSVVKGKYEQELQFAFIQENVTLAPEDEIFSGNKRTYADMRCRLRRHVVKAAERFGVQGPGEVTAS
uniref:Phosphoribosyltransferase domain-containing protein n=1 Tax=Alexandrium monilatum TaxID=311494 RepID=A0A7S4Q296_9DINO